MKTPHSKGPGPLYAIPDKAWHLMWFAIHRTRALDYLRDARVAAHCGEPERAQRLVGYAREQGAEARKEHAAATARAKRAA